MIAKQFLIIAIVFTLLFYCYYKPETRNYTNLTHKHSDIAIDLTTLKPTRGQVSYTELAGNWEGN